MEEPCEVIDTAHLKQIDMVYHNILGSSFRPWSVVFGS